MVEQMIDVFEQEAMGEYQRSLAEIGKLKSPLRPLKRSYLHFDKIIAKSIEESPTKPACKAGCFYCCYYKVEVKAHEMLLIHEHMQKNLVPELKTEILTSAKANADVIRTLTPKEHLATNIKCPFLVANQCSIYEVRPFRCRSFHAVNVDACEASYANPSDFSIATELIENVSHFSDALSQGFEAAVMDSDLDHRTYDLNTALLEVFADNSIEKRYKRGKKAFKTAIEVIDEAE
jgi:Fe-S-cluster containining protein